MQSATGRFALSLASGRTLHKVLLVMSRSTFRLAFALSATVVCSGCITPAGATHSQCVDDRPAFAAIRGRPFVLTRPLAIQVINGPARDLKGQEVIEAIDDRPDGEKLRQPLPATLPAGTPVEFTTFYETQEYAVTVWPLFLDLFPGNPRYDATFVTPGATWGIPQALGTGVTFGYDYRQVGNGGTLPWRPATGSTLRQPGGT